MDKAEEVGWADKVREHCALRGWSQSQLARRAGISPAVLSRILAGLRTPTPKHMAALAAVLPLDLTAVEELAEWVPRAAYDRVRFLLEKQSLQLETLRSEIEQLRREAMQPRAYGAAIQAAICRGLAALEEAQALAAGWAKTP